jgi:carbon monoxide dehydrogenase subunit G
MAGEQRIEAPRQKVWAALNDPEVLRQCIPGCQSLEKTADNRMRAVAAVKVGPIGARFTGDVTLSELDPPNGYRIEGEGQGGAAGFAKGGARVRLSDDGPDATRLSYEVAAQVGGRLAQLGGPIIDATAKQMAATFFRKLSQVVAPPPAEAATSPLGAGPVAPEPELGPAPGVPVFNPPSGATPVAWILAIVVGVLAGVLIGRGGGGAWLGVIVLLAIVAYAAYGAGRRASSDERAGERKP